MILKPALGLLKQTAANQRRMCVADYYPVFLTVRDKSRAMYAFAVNGFTSTDPVESAIGSSVPDHVSCINGICPDGPDSGSCPITAVDV